MVKDGVIYADSREVAEMVDKRHSDLCRDIERYISIISENAKLRSQDFFLESNYKVVGNNKTYKCYLLTKKGCDMVANKMSGEKGVLFTATYINKFYNMEKELEEKAKAQSVYKIGEAIRDIGDATKEIMAVFKCKEGMAQVTAIDMAEEMYSVNFTPLKRLVPAEPNPSTLNPTQIGKRIGKSAKQVNQLLATKGYQVKDGDTWVLTDKGIEYGEAKPYKRHGHSGYQIVWNEKVFNLM